MSGSSPSHDAFWDDLNELPGTDLDPYDPWGLPEQAVTDVQSLAATTQESQMTREDMPPPPSAILLGSSLATGASSSANTTASSFQFSGIDYARIYAELEREGYAGPRTGWAPLEGSGLKVHPKMRDLNTSTKVAYRRELEAEQLAGRTIPDLAYKKEKCILVPDGFSHEGWKWNSHCLWCQREPTEEVEQMAECPHVAAVRAHFAKGGKIRNEALNNDDTKKQHVIDCEGLPHGTRGAFRVNLCVSKGTPTLYAMTYETLRDLWIEHHVPGYKAPA